MISEGSGGGTDEHRRSDPLSTSIGSSYPLWCEQAVPNVPVAAVKARRAAFYPDGLLNGGNCRGSVGIAIRRCASRDDARLRWNSLGPGRHWNHGVPHRSRRRIPIWVAAPVPDVAISKPVFNYPAGAAD